MAPVAAEYVPAAHPMHAIAPDEGKYLPVAHNVQLLDEEDENEPAEHDMQAVAPRSCDIFPEGHCAHGVPAGYVIVT